MKPENKKKPEKAVRAVNVKLQPNNHVYQLLKHYIRDHTIGTDMAVEEYVKSGLLKYIGEDGCKCDFITAEERRNLRQKFDDYLRTRLELCQSPEERDALIAAFDERGLFGGNVYDRNAILAKNYAPTMHKNRIKKIKVIIKEKDKIAKNLEKENKNLLNVESVWFQLEPNKDLTGKTCTMCGTDEMVNRHTNQPDLYGDEYLCQRCFIDFMRYRRTFKNLTRKGRLSDIYFPDIVMEMQRGGAQLSRLLVKKAEAFLKHRKENKEKYGTERTYGFAYNQTNKAQLWDKGYIIDKIDVDTNTVYLNLYGTIYPIKYLCGNYLEAFPKYGLNASDHTFKSLINDHFNKKLGGAFLIQNIFPKPSDKSDGDETKKMAPGERDREFLLCCPVSFPTIIVPDAPAGCIIITNRYVLIHVNGTSRFIRLFHQYKRKIIYRDVVAKIKSLNAVIEKENDILIAEGKEPNLYHTILYHKIPDKFVGGRLGKYVKSQTHRISRHAIEIAKELLNKNNGHNCDSIGANPTHSILLLDMKQLNASKEKGAIVPIVQVNEAIQQKLMYDSINGGYLNWNELKDNILCPKCNRKIDMKGTASGNERLFLRDVIVTKIKMWECRCEYKLNPAILVAMNLMRVWSMQPAFSEGWMDRIKSGECHYIPPPKKEKKYESKEETVVVDEAT